MKLHLYRWWESGLNSRSQEQKRHRNFQASKYDIKSGCQGKPGKMLKMSMEGGQQNKFILTS